jgi:hypothetical protein
MVSNPGKYLCRIQGNTLPLRAEFVVKELEKAVKF